MRVVAQKVGAEGVKGDLRGAIVGFHGADCESVSGLSTPTSFDPSNLQIAEMARAMYDVFVYFAQDASRGCACLLL